MRAYTNTHCVLETELQNVIKGPFGLRNRPLEWNGYSYRIVILLFGRSLFLEIIIPMGMTNPIHTGITIPLKTKWNSYSLWNGIDFPKKLFIIFYFILTLKWLK
jgi:hypothetical protein